MKSDRKSIDALLANVDAAIRLYETRRNNDEQRRTADQITGQKKKKDAGVPHATPYATSSTTTNDSLPQEKALSDYYPDGQQLDPETIDILFPTYEYYLKKRRKLNKRSNRYQNAYDLRFPPLTSAPFSERLRNTITMKTLGKIIVKLGLALDDVPAAISEQAEEIGPVLLGGIGFLVYTNEAREGINDFIKDYSRFTDKDKNLTQDERTLLLQRMTANATKVLVAGAGMALCGFVFAAQVIEIAGELASVPGGLALVSAPVLTGLTLGLPAGLTVIAGLELYITYRNFRYAQKNETEAKAELEHYLATIAIPKLETLNRKINKLESNKQEFLNELHALAENKGFNIEERLELAASINEQITQIEKKQAKLDSRLFTILNEVDEREKKYEDCRKERLKAERSLGFASTDLVLSLVVLTLFTLGSVAGIGATGLVTFGAFPGFILLGVVAVVVAIKAFDIIDKKLFEGRGTAAIRKFAVDTGNAIKNGVTTACKKTASFFGSLFFSAAPQNTNSEPVVPESPIQDTHTLLNDRMSSEPKRKLRTITDSTLLHTSPLEKEKEKEKEQDERNQLTDDNDTTPSSTPIETSITPISMMRRQPNLKGQSLVDLEEGEDKDILREGSFSY